jgi:integrase
VSKITLDECGVKNFTHHDLRRTYSTTMASSLVGAPIHVLEKLLNHSSGTLRGVASIYNRYSYWEEMRVAVQAYETWLEQVVAGEAAPPAF